MPGGRLTHEDRRQIAAWLADGLGYAEIARRLGRPTSTISREVARNGEPGDYLADRAQRAAGRRARRRKPAWATEPATASRPTELVRDFVEQFATLLAGTGLPRMTARVFVCLLTADAGSLTAAELVRRLQISPASVSKAIASLEAMELVAREPEPGKRRERYTIDNDVWLRAWQADTGAHARVAAAARRGIEIFGAGTAAGTRLGQMSQFFGRVSDQMSGSGITLVHDALTVLAALVYAGQPLSVTELATALGWPRQRVTDALDAADHRLSPAQREALRDNKPGTR